MSLKIEYRDEKNYNMSDYEYHITFQSGADGKYYMICMDGCWSFDYENLYHYLDEKEKESEGYKPEDEVYTINDGEIFSAMSRIIYKVHTRDMQYVSFMCLMSVNDDKIGAVVDVLADQLHILDYDDDIYLDIFKCSEGNNWSRYLRGPEKSLDELYEDYLESWVEEWPDYPEDEDDVSDNEMEEGYEEALEIVENARKASYRFSNILNDKIEERARQNTDRKNYKDDKRYEGAVTNWKRDFNKMIRLDTGINDSKLSRIKNGECLRKNRKVVIYMAYMLEMTREETTELLLSANLCYKPEDEGEKRILELICKKIYKSNERQYKMQMQKWDCYEICNAAGFIVE